MRRTMLHMSRICSCCLLSQRRLQGQVRTEPGLPLRPVPALHCTCTCAVLQTPGPFNGPLCATAALTKRKRVAVSDQQLTRLRRLRGSSDEESEATDLFRATLFWAGEELADVGGGRFYPCRQASLICHLTGAESSVPFVLILRPVIPLHDCPALHFSSMCTIWTADRTALG